MISLLQSEALTPVIPGWQTLTAPPLLPHPLAFAFMATTLLAAVIFSRAAGLKANIVSFIIGFWLLATAVWAGTSFFHATNAVPPRIVWIIAPVILLILLLFTLPAGKNWVASLNLSYLTLLHTVRIPVEMVLYGLMLHKSVPELMTFTGRNFDIIAGISAPVIWFICFRKKGLRRKDLLLAWNLVCLGLLLNVVIHGVLSAPSVIQKFAFDQPNTAVLHMPYIWLPAVVVPLVFLSHLAAISQLLKKKIQ
ncbi:MAG: hypothetical protein JNL57_03310 [Bacteroidetes bacterium]|nr:hypothetical protein [Bacteroidota bacterium]